jgi:sterol desaturase/sphingolipid hydroxylase (fatty acid hydroxylase superfamily)
MVNMNIPDLTSPWWFLTTLLLFFVIVIGRYVIISGLFYAVFYIWFPEKWKLRKIGKKGYSTSQLKREISWSTFTALIFSLTGTMILFLWQQGYTRIYTDIHAYGWWWLAASLVVSMLIDETYYYWIHRLLHVPAIFRRIHRIHHQSNVTSPWTAFSFHPIEGLLLAVVLPVTLMIIPMHPFVILTQLAIMTFTSVINHLDIEIYPAHFNKHSIGRWLIGATHHSLHHKQFRYNYGLYFTFWDKWQKTESPAFDSTFDAATKRS